MSDVAQLISASKAFSIANAECKSRLCQSIENAAICGKMYYDADAANMTKDIVEDLENAGYDLVPCGSYTRISWKHFNNAPNQ